MASRLTLEISCDDAGAIRSTLTGGDQFTYAPRVVAMCCQGVMTLTTAALRAAGYGEGKTTADIVDVLRRGGE